MTQACFHCGLPIPATQLGGAYCCAGCKMAHGLLQGLGLERYYKLREGAGLPVSTETGNAGAEFDALHQRALDGGSLRVGIQGMHCAACVWLIEELFEREEAHGRIDVDPARGEARLFVFPGFDLLRLRNTLHSLGYTLGAAGEDAKKSYNDDLLWRLGVCAALAVNAMLLSVAIYFGLGDEAAESELRSFVDRAAYALSALAVVVGGPVFFRSALGALRRGIVSLDLPIALGIFLAFGGASLRYFVLGEVEYVDTIAIFVALMLGGRLLQERALERNRRRLLGDAAPDAMLTRRLVERGGERVAEAVACSDVAVGDTLVIGHGDLVPVDGVTASSATFSLDWLDGESEERRFEAGQTVPAGAFSTNRATLELVAETLFLDSVVPRLLRETRDLGEAKTKWWQRLGAAYAGAVLTAAAIAGALHWFLADAYSAVHVATAVLVVTCPCAFGVAVPLAREAAHAYLRRVGLYVRTASFLDRLQEVERIVFDKTGTLTTGRLAVVRMVGPGGARREVPELGAELAGDLVLLRAMSASSMHPKSRALQSLLGAAAPLPAAEGVPSKGVLAFMDGHEYRLGAPRWAVDSCEGDVPWDIAFSRDGELLAAFETREELRHDALKEVRRLAGARQVTILSGDRQDRVDVIAGPLGIADAIGECSPDEKAAYVEAHEPDTTLMVGDGLNDHLALLKARCAGTPAVDRPFVASRCDFYMTSPGLGPIRRAFEVAVWLRSTQRWLLAIAVSYNAVAVAIAFSGAMSPWLAAVLMPSSAVLTLSFVALRARRLGGSSVEAPPQLYVAPLSSGGLS